VNVEWCGLCSIPGRYFCIPLLTIAVSRTGLALAYEYINFNFKGVLKIKLRVVWS
jgi:hypothetical protein